MEDGLCVSVVVEVSCNCIGIFHIIFFVPRPFFNGFVLFHINKEFFHRKIRAQILFEPI